MTFDCAAFVSYFLSNSINFHSSCPNNHHVWDHANIDSRIAVSSYYSGIFMVGQPFNDSKDQQVYTEPEDNQVT